MLSFLGTKKYMYNNIILECSTELIVTVPSWVNYMVRFFIHVYSSNEVNEHDKYLKFVSCKHIDEVIPALQSTITVMNYLVSKDI